MTDLKMPLLSGEIKKAVDESVVVNCTYHGCGGADSWPTLSIN